MNYQTLLLEKKEQVMVVTINREKALNALNGLVLSELNFFLTEMEKDKSVKVIIFTGAGKKAFIAGADIAEMNEMNPVSAKEFAIKGHKVMNLIEHNEKVTIAAVNGFALGGGCEFALSCDFIYASTNAKFGQPEVNLGLIPGFGGTQRLAKVVGVNRAKEMIFSGEMMDAQRGFEAGLVNKIFELEKLLEETLKTANLIASKGNCAVKLSKEVINNTNHIEGVIGNGYEINSFANIFANVEAKEGMMAFLEKRKPNFT